MLHFLELITNYWYVIVGLIAIVALVIARVKGFIKLPTDKQIERVKEWLKYAVTEAEKELGSGTGQAKLRLVFDMFIQRFPIFSKFITFQTFSDWVDIALEWLNKQLATNEKLVEYVYGDDGIHKTIIDDTVEFDNLV